MHPIAASAPFQIETHPRGYVIRSVGGAPLPFLILQGLALVAGAALTAAALRLAILIPGQGEGVAVFHGGLALLAAAAAVLLLHFATRGLMVEVEVDLMRGELREVIRHRFGRPAVLACYGLDSGTLVSIRHGGGEASLILRLGGDGPGLCIARGPEAALAPLRARLEADLLPGPGSPPPSRALSRALSRAA